MNIAQHAAAGSASPAPGRMRCAAAGWPQRSAPLLAAMLLLIAGCATPPDARRLAEASAQLSTAVAASGDGVAAELEVAGQTERAVELRKAWQTPVRSAAALSRYADALASIAGAGREGAESVRRVADAGTELAHGVGLVLPAPAAAATAVDIAAEVYRQLAAARAARGLEEALERMQPVVERITALMSAQIDDAQVVLASANRIAEVRLRARFADETGYLLALRKERLALYGATPLTTANADRLLQIERVERSVNGQLAPMNAELRASRQQVASMSRLNAATRQALADWALAHRQLLVAVRTGSPVDAQALLQSVGELRTLLQKMRSS